MRLTPTSSVKRTRSKGFEERGKEDPDDWKSAADKKDLSTNGGGLSPPKGRGGKKTVIHYNQGGKANLILPISGEKKKKGGTAQILQKSVKKNTSPCVRGGWGPSSYRIRKGKKSFLRKKTRLGREGPVLRARKRVQCREGQNTTDLP